MRFYSDIKSRFDSYSWKELIARSKDFSFYLLATVVSSIVSIILFPFLAINLSPADYAVIGYFTSFNTLFLPVISFSLLSYYTRNYFRIEEKKRSLVLNTLVISQIVFGLVLLVFSMIGFFIYMRIANVSFPFKPYAIILFFQLFFSCIYNFLLADLRMRRESLSFFCVVIIHSVLNALFAIVFVVVLKMGALGRFYSLLLPVFIMGIFSIRRLLTGFEFDRAIFKQAISFGWPISLSALLYYFLAGVDRALLEPLNDNITFGIYNVAIQISGYLYLFYKAISQTFEPDLYKAIAENNRKRLFAVVGGIILINAVPVFIFVLLAHPVVNILTQGKYIDSAAFAQILALKSIPMSFCFLVSNVIIGYGYPKVELVNRMIGAIVSIIVLKALISKYGFLGAAWGQSVSFILMTVISMGFILWKVLKNTRSR